MGHKLSGLKALVTGGTRGIGLAIAEKLHENGTTVVVTGTREDSHISENFLYKAVNFLDHERTNDFIDEVREMNIDILINNAGINKISKIEDIDPNDFDRIQQVNVRVPFLLCQAVIPGMKKKSWGRIVNISSIFGKVSKEHRGSYSASKFALDGMTAALAAEVAKYGILANCISPGIIDTELTRTILGEKGMEKIISRIPIGRLGKADEIAVFVVWLASPENTYISGQNIAIDGGFTRV
jgi:NAD(P)-dependent dehydrogenase (short-subunit alcohol dehydrogenase family)